MAERKPEADAADDTKGASDSGKLPQSQRPGGKKRMVAAFVAFVGAGYSGMQYNPGIRTIEGELCKAMCAAGCISPQNAKDPTKVGWQRAARTDKGVSAVGNVVSLKLMIEYPDVVERINAALPEQIRVLGFTRVTKSFDARRLCDRRRYEYILPAFAFDSACCRGEEVPLAHIGAAGNIVEKHAGQELDLEAALRTLPVADHSHTSASETIMGSLSEQHQGQQKNGSCEAVQNGPDGASKEVSMTLLSAQLRDDSISGDMHERAADAPATESIPDAVRLLDSSSVRSGQPQGTAQDSKDQQHPSSNSKSEAQDRQHKQQPAAGTDQQAGRKAVSRELQNRLAAGHPVSEHYKSIRFTAEQQTRLNKILSQYEGTHNFHNYTVRVAAEDPAAMRYILSFKCEGTMEIQGQQWVRMVVLGQSFMLHEIRKLVGTALAVMRGDAPPECIKLALQPERSMVTPMAPELGLFLDECIFKSYNNRWGNDREAQISLSDFQDQVDAFKRDKIYPHIASHDGEVGINAAWLRCLTDANFKFSQWGTSKAVRLNVERGAALQAQSGLRSGPTHAGTKRKAEGEVTNVHEDDHMLAPSKGIGLTAERRNAILEAELSD